MSSPRRGRRTGVLAIPFLVAGLIGAGTVPAVASTPNMVAQWNQVAENVVVPAPAMTQIEGLMYMAYTQLAVYDAVVAIDGGYVPYGPALDAPHGASADAAVVEAAYETLLNYFPTASGTLSTARTATLATIPDGTAKNDGIAVGAAAAAQIIQLRTGDGRQLPYGSTSSFPTKTPGPGVWRLTPPAYLAPQIPWAGNMTPFVSKSADQFRPAPPPSLSSSTWVADFNEIKLMGSATSTARTAEETAVAKFYTANVPRQWNTLVRQMAAEERLSLLQTARLAAMINTVGADAGIAVLNAKYHYLFWRPVTAIDPTSVKDPSDGFGPVPGFDDGNPLTVEEPGWRPLLTTPNHPEYPAAHGTVTSAITEVVTQFKGTSKIDIDVHGFDANGAAGNLDAVRHFDKANQLRAEIINARLWGGLHYRTSGQAGVDLGRSVAKYDLKHAFEAAP